MNTANTIYLKDYQAPHFKCHELLLHVDIHDDYTEVTARLSLERAPEVGADVPLVLDGEDLTLVSVMLGDQLLAEDACQVSDEALCIASVPDAFVLETVVRIDPKNNHALSGLYQSSGNYCTQCESHGFRRITYFFDRPDVLTHFTTCISADAKKYPQLLSNGHLVDEKPLTDGRHWVKWHDPFPKPCYLFALVAGDFDTRQGTFVTKSGRHVLLRFFVEKGFVAQVPYALASLKLAMAWDERVYGREYDLDLYMVVAVSDFNFGAMENKGLNIFNTKYVLADPLTATDQDYVNVMAVIAHEYFHNWSGNRVTCRDWFQISLKEGLTVFREHGFVTDMSSAAVKRIEDATLIRDRQFAEDKGPMSHPVRPQSYIEINNFYTLTVYHKGAELIRMLSLLLGQQLYRKATDLYFSRHDGEAVTTDDFVAAMEDASGIDLTQFRLWYDLAGTPQLSVKETFDAKAQSYTLTFNQSLVRGDHPAMHIPIVMGLLSPSGKACVLHQNKEKREGTQECLLHLTEHEQTFVFYGLTEKPVPSLLRGFSAPVALSVALSDEALYTLYLHDVDPFKRWDAGQQLATQAIFCHGHADFEVKAKRLAEAFEQLLSQSHVDLQLLAQLLSLPSEAFLLQQHTPCDVDKVVAGRLALQQYLSHALQAMWLAQYHAYVSQEAYEPSLPAMSRRAIRHLCLGYLMADPDGVVMDLCYQQFATSDNLSDRIAALAALIHHGCPERDKALDAFYQQGEGQPLVRDRWFQLQAQSRVPDVVSKVRSLLEHKDFDWQNPNRVRSLVGVFSALNLPAFHQLSGEGYTLLVDVVVTLDPINPQTAARMVEPLTHWQQYDATRADLMKQALATLQQQPLSKGVYEVVTKSLSVDGG